MNITQRYERWSGSLILSGRTNATLADVVIAAVWRTVEVGSIPTGPTKLWKCGRVRFMATVLKTVEQKCSVSSNLTASAI